jgi:hypothetical protein
LGENVLRVWEKEEKVDELSEEKPGEGFWQGRKG